MAWKCFKRAIKNIWQTMNEMKELMKTPEAMREWFQNKRKEFDALPENR